MTGVPSIAIVVPVLNEAAAIGSTLQRLSATFPGCPVVVVDGGSTDDTVALARPHARVVTTERGRGRQLNAGAGECESDVLWFVHADTAPCPEALEQIRAALADPHTVGGGLSLRFDRNAPALRLLARASNLRARRLHQVFGDQAMFVRREHFDALGGFREIALMEDFDFSRRLARRGRVVVLPGVCVASARRFERHGTLRMIVFMQFLKLAYLAGVDPTRLERWYRAGPPGAVRCRIRTRRR
ncbi:MAG: TIGR04283 family arsenosugar biosynthesis glycosyltransferase [Sporichthyaceae bacterium]